MLHGFYFLSVLAGIRIFLNQAMWFPIVFISTPSEMNMGVENQAVCLDFSRMRCSPDNFVLTADGRCFSGIVGKFSETNLL